MARQRLALVIGGANGLGKASCIALAAADYRVAVADLASAQAREVLAQLEGDGHAAFGVDVSSESSVSELFSSVEASLGPISVLANFAGLLIADPASGRAGLTATSLRDWERTFAVNSTGCFLVLREMLARREKTPVEHGRIIAVSSLAGQVGGIRGSGAYAASKGAVISMTKSAAREGGPLGITANVIAPGLIESAMMRKVVAPGEEDAATANSLVRRVGRPEEIAAAVVYLASPAAAFVTGMTIDINGGALMR
jgi:NAD(P)-dependent dehydrogenase (short-subunit alcohol dehydrogenase family)